MPPAVTTMVTSATATYDPNALAAEGTIINDGYVTSIVGAEYVCKNKRDGCCKLQIYAVKDSGADCWTLKPVSKTDSQLTSEALASLTSDSQTTCKWWIQGYVWRANELACGGKTDKETMFKCNTPAYCAIVEPQDYNRISVMGISDPWTTTGSTVAESSPTDPDACYAGWTKGSAYAVGTTICDATVYMCMSELQCSLISPGAVNSQSVWLDMTGQVELPASQVIDVDFYTRDFEYANGDMAVSEHDMLTYKCIDTALPASGCWNDAPFANPLWQLVTYKPPIDSSWVVYDDFNDAYRYVSGDYVGKPDSNTVYVCYTETFCSLDPLAPYGENGWSLTQFACPETELLDTPPFVYFIGQHQWLQGDIAMGSDGLFYECNAAPQCRNAPVGTVLTYLREWVKWIRPQGGVMLDIEDETDYVMPWKAMECATFDAARTTYDSGNFVCTINSVVDPANFGYNQFVWRCASEKLCNGVSPAKDTAWFLTRNKGKITGWESADYYEFELDWPYSFGEIVMYRDTMYSCIDNRGNCGFYNPGAEFNQYTFNNYDIFYPWATVTDKIVGDRIYKNATNTQPCLNFTASMDFYPAVLEPITGFHYFIVDEYACVDEFSWVCIDTVGCNTIRPDDDREMVAWIMQPLFADYAIPDPPIVNCTYTHTEALYYENMPRYLADDIICDTRDKTEIKTNMCSALNEGGIYCNNYNMKELQDNECTQTEVISAWNITNFGNELLMLRDDAETLWWFVQADRFLDAYDWKTAVDDHSKRFWLFEFDDIAWHYHGDTGRLQMQLAFICIDEPTCQSKTPILDLTEESWMLLPFIPTNVTVPYLPLVNCMEVWVEGYPYTETSAICGLEDGIREVHQCRDPVQCSRIAPDYHNTMLQHHVWNLNIDVRGILVDTETPEETSCVNFKDVMSYIDSDTQQYALGDQVCDEGRLWTCISSSLCRLSPYASWLDQLNAWSINPMKANVNYTPRAFTLNKPTDEYCTELNVEVPVDTSADFNYYTGLQYREGRICATDPFYLDYLWSTRINSKWFDLDFINNRESFFADAAAAYAKVASGYLEWAELNYYTTVAGEIKDFAIAGTEADFKSAWHLINAHAYWNVKMGYEDYYFIEKPWTAYHAELNTLLTANNGQTVYNGFDQAAWATEQKWGALYDETEWPLNIQVISRIMSEGDWHYYFGKANVKLSDILKAFSYFPSFCGEVYDSETQDIVDVCRQELALFLTYIKYDGQQIDWSEECSDISDNVDGGCYGGDDFAQVIGLFPQFDSNSAFENIKTGQGTSADKISNGDYSIYGTPENVPAVAGLGPLPLRSIEDYVKYSIDMFGAYDILIDQDKNGPYQVLYHADQMIAVAIWRHMTFTTMGEPTLHDVAIGKWPAEATADEKANAFTSASVFEMYWCNMMVKANQPSCTSNSQDLWRDLYIWNAVILNVQYETNGIASEWYWFSNNKESWTYNPENDINNGKLLMYTGDGRKVAIYNGALSHQYNSQLRIHSRGAPQVASSLGSITTATQFFGTKKECRPLWFANVVYAMGDAICDTSSRVNDFEFTQYWKCIDQTKCHRTNPFTLAADDNGSIWELVVDATREKPWNSFKGFNYQMCFDFYDIVEGTYDMYIEFKQVYDAGVVAICFQGATYECSLNHADDQITGLPTDLLTFPDENVSNCTYLNAIPLDYANFPQFMKQDWQSYYFMKLEGDYFTKELYTAGIQGLADIDNTNIYQRCIFAEEDATKTPFVLSGSLANGFQNNGNHQRENYGWDNKIQWEANDNLWTVGLTGQVCQKADKFSIYNIKKENNWRQLSTMQASWGKNAAEADNIVFFDAIIPDEAAFTALFPDANTYFTYAGFRQAVANFPDFCANVNPYLNGSNNCKKELAAFLAWVSYTTMGNPLNLANAKAKFEDGTYINKGLSEPVNMACIDKTDPTIVLSSCNTANAFDATDFETMSQYDTYGNIKGQHFARGPLRMSGYKQYWNFQQITETQVFVDPFSVIQDEAIFWGTGLYKWMVWDDNVLSPHLAITNQVPLARAQRYAGIRAGFGQTMVMSDAAICGYYSYEQDILVSFYNKFLTAFSFDMDLLADDDNWCKKYRNDDYNNFETNWIMPLDPITASTSNLNRPDYFNADCEITDQYTFTNAEYYLSITEPNAWRQCVIYQGIAVFSKKISLRPHFKLIDQGETFAKFRVEPAYYQESYDQNWDYTQWYNVYVDKTDGTNFEKLEFKFQNNKFWLWQLIPDHRYGVKLSFENQWGEGPLSSAVYFWPQTTPGDVTLVTNEREIYSMVHNYTKPGEFSTSWNYPEDGGGYVYQFIHCHNTNWTFYDCWSTTALGRIYEEAQMKGLWIKEYVKSQNKYEDSSKAFKWTFSARRPYPPTDLTDSSETWRDSNSWGIYWGDSLPTTNAEQMEICWDDVAISNDKPWTGSDVIDYRVWWNQGDDVNEWEVLETGYTLKCLTVTTGTKGMRHAFRIESRNEVGYNSYLWDKDYSDLLQVYQHTIPATQKTATVTQVNKLVNRKTDFTVDGMLLDHVEFQWALPDDGGSPIFAAMLQNCNGKGQRKQIIFQTEGQSTNEKSIITTNEWATKDYYTYRVSMKKLVEDYGNYWGDIAPVQIAFMNFVGGTYPEKEVEADYPASCRNGLSDYWIGATQWGTTKLVKLPDPPLNLLEVTAETNSEKITFEWDTPATAGWTLSDFYESDTTPSAGFDGGADITHFSIYYYELTQITYSRLDRQTSTAEYLATQDLKTFMSLTRGSSYKVALTSSNSLGESTTQSEVTILQAQIPEVITNGETSQLIKTQLDLTQFKNYMRVKWWPDDDGGSDITAYAIELYTYETGTYKTPETCEDLTYLQDACFVEIQDLHRVCAEGKTPATSSSVCDYQLAWGDEVWFRMTATNIKGTTDWSEKLGGAILYYKAKKPTAVGDDDQQRSATTFYITFTQTPEADWNGEDVTEYSIYRKNEENGKWVYMGATHTAYKFLDNYISPCDDYEWTVTAMNGYGQSDYADSYTVNNGLMPEPPATATAAADPTTGGFNVGGTWGSAESDGLHGGCNLMAVGYWDLRDSAYCFATLYPQSDTTTFPSFPVYGFQVYDDCSYISGDEDKPAGINLGKLTKYTLFAGVDSSAVATAVDPAQSYYIVFINEEFPLKETVGRTYTSTSIEIAPVTIFHNDWGTIDTWKMYTTHGSWFDEDDPLVTSTVVSMTNETYFAVYDGLEIGETYELYWFPVNEIGYDVGDTVKGTTTWYHDYVPKFATITSVYYDDEELCIVGGWTTLLEKGGRDVTSAEALFLAPAGDFNSSLWTVSLGSDFSTTENCFDVVSTRTAATCDSDIDYALNGENTVGESHQGTEVFADIKGTTTLECEPQGAFEVTFSGMNQARTQWVLTPSVGTNGGSAITSWNVKDANGDCAAATGDIPYVSLTDSCYSGQTASAANTKTYSFQPVNARGKLGLESDTYVTGVLTVTDLQWAEPYWIGPYTDTSNSNYGKVALVKIDRLACTNDYEIRVPYAAADWHMGTYDNANPVDHLFLYTVNGCRYEGSNTAVTDAEWKTYFSTTVSTDCFAGWKGCVDWNCDSYDMMFNHGSGAPSPIVYQIDERTDGNTTTRYSTASTYTLVTFRVRTEGNLMMEVTDTYYLGDKPVDSQADITPTYTSVAHTAGELDVVFTFAAADPAVGQVGFYICTDANPTIELQTADALANLAQVDYLTACSDYDSVMMFNTKAVAPETDANKWTEPTATTWTVNIHNFHSTTITAQAWDETITVTVCATMFRRAWCATAKDLLLSQPNNPADPTEVSTEIINSQLVYIDWTDPTLEDDTSCTVDAYTVWIVTDAGTSPVTKVLESTYCTGSTVVENHMCAIPLATLQASPYSLQSGEKITAMVMSACGSLDSGETTGGADAAATIA